MWSRQFGIEDDQLGSEEDIKLQISFLNAGKAHVPFLPPIPNSYLFLTNNLLWPWVIFILHGIISRTLHLWENSWHGHRWQSESKKDKEPRNQVQRGVWKSEECFGLIPRLNVPIWRFKVLIFLLVGILMFLLLCSPCQISEPHDNPFWENE